MFFEDEKDFIESGADIHIDEDGTVSWEDVLSDDGDEIVSVKSVAQNSKPQPKDLGDELQLIQDEDDIDDEQLAEILTEQQAPKQKAFDNFGTKQEESSDDDFDIDKQLASVVLEQNKQAENDDSIKPRKTETKKSSSISPIFIIVALIAIGVGGYFTYTTFFADQGMGNMPQITNNQQPAAEETSVEEEQTEEQVEEQTQEESESNAQVNAPADDNIPVVNEEQAKQVKPDEQKLLEKKKAEKKQVINVVPTGRTNPFMPISKYVSVTIPQTNLDYDHSGIPKPPEKYGEQKEPITKLMSITVSGIMYDEVKPSAIITFDENDYFVQKGDKLDDYRIVDIARNYVTVALGKNIYRANIGEEFKISTKYDGSAKQLPQTQGGGRQYYSMGKRDQISETSNLRYVSEEEVIINAR